MYAWQTDYIDYLLTLGGGRRRTAPGDIIQGGGRWHPN